MDRELIIVRHGHAHSNATGVIGGPAGCAGLTDTGQRQAELLAARLHNEARAGHPINALYTSPSTRAQQTADIVADALGLPTRVLSELRDPDLGPDADGRTWATIVDAFPGEPSTRLDQPLLPGAEAWPTYLQRTWTTLNGLLAGQTRRTLIIGHAETVKAAHHHFLGHPADQRLPIKFAVDNTAITRWHTTPPRNNHHGPPRWILLAHNDTAHLTRTDESLSAGKPPLLGS